MKKVGGLLIIIGILLSACHPATEIEESLDPRPILVTEVSVSEEPLKAKAIVISTEDMVSLRIKPSEYGDFEVKISELEKDNKLTYSWKMSDTIRAYNANSLRPILLRDLMDAKLIGQAKRLSTQSDTMEQLANYLYYGTQHTDWYLAGLAEKGQESDDFTTPDHNFSDHNFSAVIRYKDICNKTLLRCLGFASMNSSLVSWLYGGVDTIILQGWIPNDLGYDGHAIAMAIIEGEHYLFDNQFIFKLNLRDSGIDFESVDQLADYYNGDYFKTSLLEYIDSYYSENIVAYGNEITGNKDFEGDVQEIFQIDYFTMKEDSAVAPFQFDLSGGTAFELSMDMMTQVYEKALTSEDDNYDLAKYAYHTMLVKYPEYYIRQYSKLAKNMWIERADGFQDVTSDAFYAFVRDLDSVDELLNQVSRFSKESIYEEYHRFMLPEYIIMFEQYDEYGLPILVQASLEYMGYKSYVAWTDLSSYVMINDGNGGIIYDLNTMEIVDYAYGQVELIMNSLEAYYPLMDKNSLSTSSKEFLDELILIDYEMIQ